MSDAWDRESTAPGSGENSLPTHPDIVARFEELGLIDDPDFAAEALNTFILDGIETIEKLATASRNGDAESCERLAHRIKGAALNIGASRLGEIARILEELGRTAEISGAGPRVEDLRIEFESVHRFATSFIERNEAA